jgi:ABC-type uncharacterized transport system involved in gliding motility auxiliary subunit
MKREGLSSHLLWLGLVVMAAGITFGFLGADYNFWSLLGVLGGSLLILLYVVLNFSEVQEFFLAYSTRQWANMALFIVLLVAVIIVVQMIANNHNYRFDFTTDKKMSVVPLTKKILREVETPVHVTGFYREDERDKLQELLEMYRLASDRFTYQMYNLDRNPGLAKKYGINAYDSSVVETGGKLKKVKYPSEEALINAIVNLTSPTQKVVYFLFGHGEHSLKGTEEDCPCYGLVKEALETENISVQTFLFAGGKPIPEDADVVVIGGPTVDFADEEVEILDQYLRRGGGLILAVDPGKKEKLEAFLEGYGVALGDDIIVDPEDYLIEKSPLVPLVPYYFTHPITEGYTIPSVLALARSVEKMETPPSKITVKSLARSGEKSWAETDIDSAERGEYQYDPGYDRRGPVTVAVVSEIETDQTKGETSDAGGNGSIKGRIAVFGDSDFLINRYFNLIGNKDLLLNTVHWMTEAESLISIRRKKPSEEDSLPVYLEPMRARLIFISIVILQPIAVLTAGLVIALRRRRKG